VQCYATRWSDYHDTSIEDVFTDTDILFDYMQDLIKSYQKGLLHIVAEDFTAGNARTKEQAETLRMVGKIEGWCMAKKVDLHKQKAAQREGYLGIARALAREQRVSVTRHSLDALAHALAYIDRRGWLWDKERLISSMEAQGVRE